MSSSSHPSTPFHRAAGARPAGPAHCAQGSVPAAEAPVSVFIPLSTGPVHCVMQGSGPPLVLLHANPGDSRDFAAVMPVLARHHRVIALDWPGYGQSPVPTAPQTWGATRFHQVLCEFLARMALPKALFIGNSLGGNAAARLAIEMPERVAGLVLVSPGGFTPHTALTRAFCRLQGSRCSLPPRWWAAMYLRRRTPVTRDMLARAATLQSAGERVALNRAVWRSFTSSEHDLSERARAIRCPTLLVFGRDDPAIDARKDGVQAGRSIPHARSVTLACGHAPFAEVPDAFLDEVQPFLRDCAGTLEDEAPRSRLR